MLLNHVNKRHRKERVCGHSAYLATNTVVGSLNRGARSAVLVPPKICSASRPLTQVCVSMAVARILLAVFYWFYLLDPMTKTNLLARLKILPKRRSA